MADVFVNWEDEIYRRCFTKLAPEPSEFILTFVFLKGVMHGIKVPLAYSSPYTWSVCR